MLGLLPSVYLFFQMWGSPAFAARWRLLRHMQGPQTHCASHLDSESKWEMQIEGCLKLCLIPLTQLAELDLVACVKWGF